MWDETGIQDDELIPPALIHTLLENGITHSIPSDEQVIKFLLTFSRTGKNKQYTLEVLAVITKPSFALAELGYYCFVKHNRPKSKTFGQRTFL